MDIEFYNTLFKILFTSIVAYGCVFGFLFLVFAGSSNGISKREWLFISLFPLLITIVLLLFIGIALTGGF